MRYCKWSKYMYLYCLWKGACPKSLKTPALEEMVSMISNMNVKFGHLTQSISNEPWTSRHNGASGPYSHMASFLHDRALVLEVFLGPFSNVNDRIMPMSDAASSEGRRPRASNKGLCNLTLRYVVFKVFHNLFTHSFTDWRASAHLYFWETLPR